MSVIDRYPGLSPSQVAQDHDLRSQHVQELILKVDERSEHVAHPVVPRLIVQFWDDPTTIPSDVQDCLDTWAPLEAAGYARQLFGDTSATVFIGEHFEERHELAFRRCNHPAMRADYFRLCFILEVGGFYVDADDAYRGLGLDDLFDDGRLKLQPLCYDVASDSMVEPLQAAQGVAAGKRIFYVNNNPLAAPPGHPLVASALDRATTALLQADENDRDIQSLTGPGNLTACLVAHAAEGERSGADPDFSLLRGWDSRVSSRWPLQYRSDSRNWRNWARSSD